MVLLDIIAYIIIGIACMLCILFNTSTNQVKSRRLQIAYISVTAICFVVAIFIDISSSDKVSNALQMDFLTFGALGPSFISRIIVRRRLKAPIVYLQKRITLTSILLVITLGFLTFLVLMLYLVMLMNIDLLLINNLLAHKALLSGVNNATFHVDDPHFYISFALGLIAIMALVINKIFQPTTGVSANGILLNGRLWDWSNFQSFNRVSGDLYNAPDVQQLYNKDALFPIILKPKTGHSSKEIRLAISYNDRQVVENLLKAGIRENVVRIP